MTTAQNPFALLEDESAEPVVEQKQQVKKSSASAQQAKKAPLKESPASQQRVRCSKRSVSLRVTG